jgi:uncharacterized protein DUF4229
MSAPADPRARSVREPGLAATVALYTLARLGLLALIAALLLMAGTPLVIALLVALIVALPLSMFVFRGLRTRLDVALATARARRGEERTALRARLRGEEPEPPAGTAQAVEAAEATEAAEDGAEPADAPEAGASDAGSGDRPESQPDARGD